MKRIPPAKGKRQRLAEAIARVNAIGALRPLHDRGRTPILMLAYHRIVEVADEPAYPLDLGLISATPEEFAWQMAALRDSMTPVSLTAIAEALARGTALPRRCVAVTFDDGFCDTYEHAFPILRQHGIPATVFVSTGYVESGRPFWFEFTAHLMLRIAPQAIRLDGLAQALPSGDSVDERRASIVVLHQLLKGYPPQRRQALVEQWSADFSAVLERRACELSKPISWQQIREMAAHGIEFGSHTVSHPNLALTPDEMLERELRESRSALEAVLGREVRALAYPFGTPHTYSRHVMRRAQSAGYVLACSYRQGVNWLGDLEPYDLRRIGMSRGMTPEQFRTLIALPAWFRPALTHID